MKKIFSLALLLVAFSAGAQTTFLNQVSVDFEKRVAVWPLLKEIQPEWFERSKDNRPKEVMSYFNFTGDASHSLYKQTKAAVVERGKWFEPFADNNVVYNNYVAGTTTAQKPIYEQTYLVEDSLLKIKWKITPDTRNIAGFECRKAVGILYDTIAVFAFYAEEIPVSGGPEGISGLPGMILGMGVPRLHTTWFATRVQLLNDAGMKVVTPATKGKKVDRSGMMTALEKALKDWDQYGKKMMLAWLI
ncbi:GLPGLI family protein [Nostoc ellipsosporum NOK]|nr:GLPGLI family protein [Nostoc ellipsosporum NOK]